MDNPLLTLGFEIPFDRIAAEHVEPAFETLLSRTREAIEAVAAAPAPPTYDSTLGALERATEALDLAMTVVSHLEGVATTPALRDAYNAVKPKVSELYSSIPTHAGLYAVLRAFAQTEEAGSLDATRARFLKKTLDDFRRHGAELDDDGKEELRTIDVELSQLTTRFAQNLLDATNEFELIVTEEAQLAGLPPTARDSARASAEAKGLRGWRFTLQAPSVIAVLTHLDDRAIREEIWTAYDQRGNGEPHDNRPLVSRILEARRKKATLLGYGDFADLVLEERMAGDGARAQRFVDDLRARTLPFAEADKHALLAFRRELEGDDAPELAPWDVAYYAEKQRKARFEFDEEELRAYFPADRVVAGLFEVARRLYGLHIEERAMPTWDDAVRTFGVHDGGGRLVAAFYVDLYPRENKRGGAWMHPLVTGQPTDDGLSPHLGLFCANVNAPVAGRPALLGHREVETLFHEFGHLLHHVLSEVPVRSLAGTSVAWDFVELPSQIMENWCWEREALDLFARHYETEEPIPDALFERMKRARTYRAASATMRQIGFASVDLALHRLYRPDRDGDVMEYGRRILEEHAPTPLPAGYGMLAGFGHLFASPVGYAAAYYSYKWAEVLDADAFSRFRDEGIFDEAVGAAFRNEILARGDSRDPMELFVAFMGREPRLEALLERSGLVAR